MTSISKTYVKKTPQYVRSSPSVWFWLLSIACLLFSSGCSAGGPAIAEVAGTVTLKGEPVSGVIVSFVPDSGEKTSGGSTDSEGAFRLIYNPRQAGAIVGGHTVYVALDGKQAKALTGSANSITPSKKVEVVSGDNQFDLELEDFTVER